MKYLGYRASGNRRVNSIALPLAATTITLCFPILANAAGMVPESSRHNAFAAFAAVIALTLVITWINARRGRSASEFYTAGGGISGGKNRLARLPTFG